MSPAGLLQALPIPHKVWEDISMNFLGGLPRAHRVDTILVVVDRFTKFSHFLPLSHPYTAKQMAKIFTKEIVRLHGFLAQLCLTEIGCSSVTSGLNCCAWQVLHFVLLQPIIPSLMVRQRLLTASLKLTFVALWVLTQSHDRSGFAGHSFGSTLPITLQRAELHPIFHVSQLKKAINPSVPAQPLPLCLTENLELILKPEYRQGIRTLPDGTLEVLIQWEGLPDFENT
ncbi:hypothetical protein H6P81_010353 [Aristolochia fimbriata]|uniref:Chromo domain-containing protein n=1 Tax=Aristolochia fimbriata TaxID=158543 RepID=A0AAV7ENS3_ARIFI|nr:hypothetical protein H6P81_010353 [Aristolochia fimbriata]